MSVNRYLTWRVQNIPSHFTEERLKSCFHSDDKKYIEVKSLVPDVNNYDRSGTLTATLLFIAPGCKKPCLEDNDELEIDKDFIGFTPLNTPTDDVCADIIAITGLAGHAFGSWAHNSQQMWFRDYLPKDIQNRARILIFGYESQIQGTLVAKSIISDFGNSFIQSLMDLRDHPSCRDRPLILIGHSLGALIIKQAITDLNPNIRSCLPLRTVLFFGAPHKGLEVKALETLVKESPSQSLISELKPESPTLAGLSRRFRHIAKDLSIHSYYESRPTNTVVQGPDGIWSRTGEPKVIVERSSALLDIDREETQLQVDGDHKAIAKLRRGQGGIYPNVLRIIKNALQSASEQFAAASRAREENQSATTTTSQNRLEEDDQDYDEDSSEESENEYDDENLICDSCCDEFSKSQTHYHCPICEKGKFNLCQSCKRKDNSCPGGHDLMERRLGNVESSDDVDDQNDDNANMLMCYACETDFPMDQLHFHCIFCNDGDCSICLPCRKKGRICPGRHSLIKRQIPIDSPTITKTDPKRQQALPKLSPKPSSSNNNNDNNKNNCNTRKNNKNTSSTYCDIAEYSYILPKRPKSPKHSEQKDWDDSTTAPTCRVCDESFNSRSKLFNHLKEEGHMFD